MDVRQRHHTPLPEQGRVGMVFAHGFGCDPNMWRLLAPRCADRFRVMLFDFTGAGRSDIAAQCARRRSCRTTATSSHACACPR